MLVVIEEMLLKVLQPKMLLPEMLNKKKSSEKSKFCRMLHSIFKACTATLIACEYFELFLEKKPNKI